MCSSDLSLDMLDVFLLTEQVKKYTFVLDGRATKIPITAHTEMETRYRMLERSHPEHAERSEVMAQEGAGTRLA